VAYILHQNLLTVPFWDWFIGSHNCGTVAHNPQKQLPSRELTYLKVYLKMIFLLYGWDMLDPRVRYSFANSHSSSSHFISWNHSPRSIKSAAMELQWSSLSIQICRKKGINPTILLWGWDWDQQTYSREGYGSLGLFIDLVFLFHHFLTHMCWWWNVTCVSFLMWWIYMNHPPFCTPTIFHP